jgi:hypothetical protein
MATKKNKGQARLRLIRCNESVSGGYKSGRRSNRDTPDAFSSGNTRSAGTRPDFLHFWSAWYRTPNFSESGCKPPPPLIARSTGFMTATLQLKSVIGQQPSNVIGFATMQLMVAKAKKDAMALFSAMLNAEFDRLNAPKRGRPAWMKRELKTRARFETTTTSCQKWLGGQQIPRSSHLAIIVKAFGLNHQLLMAGEWEPPPGISDQHLLGIHRLWPLITDESGRKHVLEAAEFVARAKAAANEETPPEKRHRP